MRRSWRQLAERVTAPLQMLDHGHRKARNLRLAIRPTLPRAFGQVLRQGKADGGYQFFALGHVRMVNGRRERVKNIGASVRPRPVLLGTAGDYPKGAVRQRPL